MSGFPFFTMSKTEDRKQKTTGVFDLGTWVGRKQAFSLIAGKCSAADAECLRNIRENKRYRALNVSWDQFCREYAGLSRASADRFIRQLEEFGPRYFQLAGVTRITPEEYRLIAPAVSDGGVCCDGETIAIEPENAPRLTQAIETLRGRVATPEVAPTGAGHALDRAEKQLNALVREFERLSALNLDLAAKVRLQSALGAARLQVDRILLALGA